MFNADLDIENTIALKYFLSKYSLSAIESEYNTFKARCYNSGNISENSVKRLVDSLFVKDDIKFSFAVSIEIKLVDKGIVQPPLFVFRSRKSSVKSNSDLTLSNIEQEIGKASDLWEKPRELCKTFERVNKVGESVLYTSYETTTTFCELNLQPNDYFYVVAYKRNKRIKASTCVNFVYYNQLTEVENLKRYAIFTLLRNEFTRALPSMYSKQSQYYISYYLAKRFFIAENTCGLEYPSVKGIGANNFVFFDNEAKKCLDIICVRLCRFADTEAKRSSNLIDVIMSGFLEENKIKWFGATSQEAKDRLNNHFGFDMFFAK